MIKNLLIIAVFFIASSFVSVQAQVIKSKSQVETEDPDNLAKEYFSQIMGVAISTTSNLKLYQFIYDWIGTPYRWGGSTKKGVDCSAFTKEIYSKAFGIILHRTSRDIFGMTSPVNRNELKEGDLIFFKIKSRSITHVGIYLGNNRFAHASSSRGVVLSNLNEPYYKRYFFSGGRLLDKL